MENEYISLKWGTLKAWKITSAKGLELMKRYHDLGSTYSSMQQNDTREQKDIICQMIDECSADTIHLDWDGLDVTKEEAKKYVLEYGKEPMSDPSK